MSGTVNDLGNSINAANRAALTDMINLATAASGKDISVNDVALGTNTYTFSAGKWTGADGTVLSANKPADEALIEKLNAASTGDKTKTPAAGTTATMIEGVVCKVGDEIQAGGLVELQFRIDQMMAAVQEGIKNTGKVSQTREGAARA